MKNIKQEIKNMVALDQKARFENQDQIEQVDSTNRKQVKKITKTYGYIAIPEWGREASHNFWLLIQHFPKEEIEFMENYVVYMEENKSSFLPEDIAYLRDRVNLYKEIPQVYGTQFFEDEKNREI